jgi:hypothetical protein
MSHVFTIESASIIQRGTDQENDIYAMIKFKELSAPVPFYARKSATESQRRELWERLNSGEFGEVVFPPSNYSTHPKTQEELELSEKSKRDELLLKSDWTQIADSGLSAEKKTEWAGYRQSLRDLPKQSGFPYEIIWPSQPV